MLRHAVPLFAAPLLAATAVALPAAAAEVQVQSAGPVIELQVSQQVLGNPDKAMVSAGVTSRANTAVEAMRLNASEMDKVLARLRQLGIPDERVQTSGITLNPQYNYRNNLPPQFLGYDATNTVAIELRDLERVGPVLDALVAAGATNLNGPMWGIVDDAPQKSQARKAAFAAAEAQAGEYARMAGFAGYRLLAVEEAMSFQQPMYDQIVVTGSAPRAQALSTPTRPGQVATQITMTVKYEMTR